jgi:hypothetical protein
MSEYYSTCSPDLVYCPDNECDELERSDPRICPQDCTVECKSHASIQVIRTVIRRFQYCAEAYRIIINIKTVKRSSYNCNIYKHKQTTLSLKCFRKRQIVLRALCILQYYKTNSKYMKERERERERERDCKRKTTFYKFFDFENLESRSRKVLHLEGFRKISYPLSSMHREREKEKG